MKKYYWIVAVLAISAAVLALILMARAFGVNVNFTEQPVSNVATADVADSSLEKIALEKISNCTSISRGKVYTNTNDLITDKSGNIYLTIKENAVSSAELSICKHLVTSAKSVFTDVYKNYAVEYFPSVETIALANMKDGAFPVLALYNIPSAKLSLPELPVLTVDGSRWEVSTAYDDNFAYILYYPSVDGGCSTNECYKKVIAENKKLRQSIGMYLLRSDGIQVKLSNSTPEGQLKLDFSYDGEAQNVEVVKVVEQTSIVYKEAAEKLY